MRWQPGAGGGEDSPAAAMAKRLRAIGSSTIPAAAAACAAAAFSAASAAHAAAFSASAAISDRFLRPRGAA